MFILIVFAFLAGIVTILSPCILPVLPLILAGSVTQGRLRPWGIIIGFIFSFTFFTLSLSLLVRATGVSADVVRLFAIIVIVGFGVVLLFPWLQQRVEIFFSKIPGMLPKQEERSGFLGGILLGLSLGLLWTPCVGPILASVIALALTGSVNQAAVWITLAYATGTALPMLAITYGGRGLLTKLPWLSVNTARIQQGFGVIMIIVGIAISFNLDRQFQAYILRVFPQYGAGLTKIEDIDIVRKELENIQSKSIIKESIGKTISDVVDSDFGLAPELMAGGEWFNSKPLSIKKLRGKVVLVDFWTYTCINCIRTFPYIEDWHEKYASKGLVVIGVHTPEFEFEKNPVNVKKALKDFGLKYPIMQDNDYSTWSAYDNHYWPAKYLIDKNGRIRWVHFGEGGYIEAERKIQELLKESGSDVGGIAINRSTYRVDAQTPELYLGYGRVEYLSSPEKILFDRKSSYSVPSTLPDDTFAYQGNWVLSYERALPSQNAVLKLNFKAKNVFLVMRPNKKAGHIRVFLDDKIISERLAGEDVHDGLVTIDSDRLYRLVNMPVSGRHILKLEFLDNNCELYAFTFG